MSMLWECPGCGAFDETGWLGPDEDNDCPECGESMHMA